nr:hypothetical protein [Actinomycetota bacterium]
DPTSAVAQAADYVSRLRAARSPRVTVHHPPNVPHGIAGSAEGLELLGRILRG